MGNEPPREETEMEFSVIYSFDVRRDQSVEPYNPPKNQRRRLWDLTEGNEQYEFDYLGESYKHGKHRKWCALLTRKQFDEFVSHTGIYPEDVETLGSLGAPGCGFGLAPAISFNGGPDVYGKPIWQNAYVTPLPEVEPNWERFERPLLDAKTIKEHKARRSDQVWDRIKRAILSVYS